MKKLKEKWLNTSIQYKLVITLTMLIAATIVLCWFVNKTFLTSYYESVKMNTLGKMYDDVNAVYNTESNKGIFEKDDSSLTLERMSSNKNVDLFVFNLYYNIATIEYPVNATPMQQTQLSKRILEYYTNDSVDLKGKTLLKTYTKYNIYKVYDKRMKSNYIELYGRLDNGSTIYARTNLEIVRESVGIANKFFAYAGIFAIFAGAVIMVFIGKSFTQPILQLSDIAKRMSDLDFEVKYEIKAQDEIGELGSSINRLSEKLEMTISELKCANNELQRDIEHKIQIDEMRKDFLSNVSHELKTPIALIQGYAEGLKENINEDEDSRDFYCEVIMDEALKMNKMVRKLLNLNQIEFGSNQVEFIHFDIVSLIHSVVSAANILIKQKEAEIDFNETEPLFVWADEYLTEEVVTNYLSNALNHAAGERKIEIRLEHNGEKVKVSVFNTGEPIPEDDIDKIWIKFYKVDKARTREYGGSGIGLSIVKAIMDSMNQKCGVQNKENGVEFWFELDTKN